MILFIFPQKLLNPASTKNGLFQKITTIIKPALGKSLAHVGFGLLILSVVANGTFAREKIFQAKVNDTLHYSGNILFNGNNIKNDKELLSEFRFLGQKNTLKGNLSVQQNIAMWELIYQVKSDIYEIAKILNIEQILNVDG